MRVLPVVLVLAAAAPAAAQTFKVAKYNIGGEGGTDYITAERGTGARAPRGPVVAGWFFGISHW